MSVRRLLLARFDCNRRAPVCKSISGDGDLIGNSWRDILECESSIVLCYGCDRIAGRPLQNYLGIRDRIAADIDYRAQDGSSLYICHVAKLR